MILALQATKGEQTWASAWLAPFGITKAWLDPGGGARALLMGGKAEAELDIEAQDGALMVRFAAARQKVLGASKLPAAVWWPMTRAKIEAGTKDLPPTVSLRLDDERRALWVSVQGMRFERVLILSERLTIVLEKA